MARWLVWSVDFEYSAGRLSSSSYSLEVLLTDTGPWLAVYTCSTWTFKVIDCLLDASFPDLKSSKAQFYMCHISDVKTVILEEAGLSAETCFTDLCVLVFSAYVKGIFLYFPHYVGCKNPTMLYINQLGSLFIFMKTNCKITSINKHGGALGLKQWVCSESGPKYTVKPIVGSCQMPTQSPNHESCWVHWDSLVWSLTDSTFIRKVLQAALLVRSETKLLLLCWSPQAEFQFSRQGRGDLWQRKATKQFLWKLLTFKILSLFSDHTEISLQIFRYH